MSEVVYVPNNDEIQFARLENVVKVNGKFLKRTNGTGTLIVYNGWSFTERQCDVTSHKARANAQESIERAYHSMDLITA